MVYLQYAKAPDPAVVSKLVQSGVYHENDNSEGNTFHAAAHNPNTTPELLDALVELGSDPHSRNDRGQSVFHYYAAFASSKNAENALSVVECLSLKHKVDINAVDQNGFSPLLCSSVKFRDFPKLVEKLLTLGANPNHQNNNGETFISFVMRGGDVESDCDDSEDNVDDHTVCRALLMVIEFGFKPALLSQEECAEINWHEFEISLAIRHIASLKTFANKFNQVATQPLKAVKSDTYTKMKYQEIAKYLPIFSLNL